jgi:hypothetical protein
VAGSVVALGEGVVGDVNPEGPVVAGVEPAVANVEPAVVVRDATGSPSPEHPASTIRTVMHVEVRIRVEVDMSMPSYTRSAGRGV